MIRTKKTVIGLEIHLETQNYGCISGYILLFKTGLHGQPIPKVYYIYIYYIYRPLVKIQ